VTKSTVLSAANHYRWCAAFHITARLSVGLSDQFIWNLPKQSGPILSTSTSTLKKEALFSSETLVPA